MGALDDNRFKLPERLEYKHDELDGDFEWAPLLCGDCEAPHGIEVITQHGVKYIFLGCRTCKSGSLYNIVDEPEGEAPCKTSSNSS